MPGSIRSSSTMSGRASRNAVSARSPSATKDGRNPSLRRTMPSISARAGSSSTTSTRALMRSNIPSRSREVGTATSKIRDNAVLAARTVPIGSASRGHPHVRDRDTMGRVRTARGDRVPQSQPTGVLPLRPLTFGELLDAAVLLLRGNARVFLAVAALLAAGEQVLMYPLRIAAGIRPPFGLPYSDRLGEYWLMLGVGLGTEVFIIAL